VSDDTRALTAPPLSPEARSLNHGGFHKLTKNPQQYLALAGGQIHHGPVQQYRAYHCDTKKEDGSCDRDPVRYAYKENEPRAMPGIHTR